MVPNREESLTPRTDVTDGSGVSPLVAAAAASDPADPVPLAHPDDHDQRGGSGPHAVILVPTFIWFLPRLRADSDSGRNTLFAPERFPGRSEAHT